MTRRPDILRPPPESAATQAQRVQLSYPDQRLTLRLAASAHALAKTLGARRVDIPTHRLYRFPDGSILLCMVGRKLKASPPQQTA